MSESKSVVLRYKIYVYLNTHILIQINLNTNFQLVDDLH